MANFLEATADIDLRLNEYSARVARIEAHLQRGEMRAARARLTGFLEELVQFASDIELPLETIVVGAQLGFFSGDQFFRGRLPGALIGGAAGWLYGQQVLQRHRLILEAMAEKVAALTIFMEMKAKEEAAGAPEAPAAAGDESEADADSESDGAERVTAEMDRPEPP